MAKMVRTLMTTTVQHTTFPRLSPQQIHSILRMNDSRVEVTNDSAVNAFETNYLAANNPIEDRFAAGHLVHSQGMLFGVYDGHGGFACAHAAKERLLKYLASAVTPPNILAQFAQPFRSDNVYVQYRQDSDCIEEETTLLSDQSLQRFVTELLSTSIDNSDETVEDILKKACLRFDADISSEAMPSLDGKLNTDSLQSAFSGCCATVAYVDKANLHVANIGDCRAVLGLKGEANTWLANPLTVQHNVDNESEVKRIHGEHPPNECHHVIKAERLLGQLAPLRAFGDMNYKWPAKLLKDVFHNSNWNKLIPPNYHSPPYLTACPQISFHRLTPRDKFLIIATDGLWDMLSPQKVVQLVGEHMQGRQTVDPYRPSKMGHITLREINNALRERKIGLATTAADDNAATHLIRNALGATDKGIEHSKLSNMLCIPEDMVRNFRDDISAIVVYFNTEYLLEKSGHALHKHK